ncbi:hypothetical protein DFS34DRAFT_596248 [Phlyctochytrium arcticum]|nr:hypothetical protein DFS34DRAFT_596248 [Phlyctochytrium arcticum]
MALVLPVPAAGGAAEVMMVVDVVDVDLADFVVVDDAAAPTHNKNRQQDHQDLLCFTFDDSFDKHRDMVTTHNIETHFGNVETRTDQDDHDEDDKSLAAAPLEILPLLPPSNTIFGSPPHQTSIPPSPQPSTSYFPKVTFHHSVPVYPTHSNSTYDRAPIVPDRLTKPDIYEMVRYRGIMARETHRLEKERDEREAAQAQNLLMKDIPQQLDKDEACHLPTPDQSPTPSPSPHTPLPPPMTIHHRASPPASPSPTPPSPSKRSANNYLPYPSSSSKTSTSLSTTPPSPFPNGRLSIPHSLIPPPSPYKPSSSPKLRFIPHVPLPARS